MPSGLSGIQDGQISQLHFSVKEFFPLSNQNIVRTKYKQQIKPPKSH